MVDKARRRFCPPSAACDRALPTLRRHHSWLPIDTLRAIIRTVIRATAARRSAMHDHGRRRLLFGVALLASAHPLPAAAQSSLPQPAEPTKAAFLERARVLRDESARAGDQPYGAVVVRDGVIV